MAKRSRVGARPGQRRPLQRTGPRPEPTAPAPVDRRPTGSVTPEEEARAAALEAAILAEEKAAEDTRRQRERGRRVPATEAAWSAVPLAVRASEEYAYVRRDMRRITILGGLLIGVLLVLHLLANVLQVI